MWYNSPIYVDFVSTRLFFTPSALKLVISTEFQPVGMTRNLHIIQNKTTRTDERDTILLQKTHAGVIVEDEAHLQEIFQELLDEFNTNGKIACDSVGAENYSRKIQVKKLAEIIKSHN